MKNRSLTDWIQLAGNLGLIAGLVLVAVQIRDSNRIASAEMFSASIESTITVNTAQLGEAPQEAMSRVLYQPDQATVADLYIADRIYDALVRILVRAHVFTDLGVYGSDEITPRGFVMMHFQIFACPYGLAWLDQTIARFHRGGGGDAPMVKSMEEIRQLAGTYAASDAFVERRDHAARIVAGLLEGS